MTDILFIDAAYPPKSLDGAEGLVFYAGGDTPHVWSPADIKRFNATYLLPTWVRSNPAVSLAVPDAMAFILRLETVYHAPRGILVALDSETSVNAAYVAGFVRVMNQAGYPVIDYGSESTLFGNKNPDGYYWGADWTGRPGIRPGEDATQYISFKDHDLSDFSGKLPLWNIRKRIVPTPQVTSENGFTVQGGWRFCVKCKCLVHAPEGESAPCAGGGVHALHSHNYLILFSDTLL